MLDADMAQAARLLATVVGQDLDKGEDGSYRIAKRVAADRVISTVDPEARHGHKTSDRSFDGYKGRISIEPDSGVVTSVFDTSLLERHRSHALRLIRGRTERHARFARPSGVASR